jgi:hypothetical protein
MFNARLFSSIFANALTASAGARAITTKTTTIKG